MVIKRSVVAVVLLVSVVGCAKDDASPQSAPSPSATSATTSGRPSPCATPAFTANTDEDTGSGSGAILGLIAATSGAQPCFDRVVFTLGGRAAGLPGWRVGYLTAPTSDGSGNPVTVHGPVFLQVQLTHVGYPGDTGIPEPSVKRFTPPGTAKVREVVLDGVFEGRYTAFIGLSAKLPFRVFRLSNPTRVVVDVRHS